MRDPLARRRGHARRARRRDPRQAGAHQHGGRSGRSRGARGGRCADDRRQRGGRLQQHRRRGGARARHCRHQHAGRADGCDRRLRLRAHPRGDAPRRRSGPADPRRTLDKLVLRLHARRRPARQAARRRRLRTPGAGGGAARACVRDAHRLRAASLLAGGGRRGADAAGSPALHLRRRLAPRAAHARDAAT